MKNKILAFILMITTILGVGILVQASQNTQAQLDGGGNGLWTSHTHSYTEKVWSFQPTCTKYGKYKWQCSCGEDKKNNDGSIAWVYPNALGHNDWKRERQNGTNEEKDKEHEVYCTRCGIFRYYEKHKWVGGKGGDDVHHCEGCGHKHTDSKKQYHYYRNIGKFEKRINMGCGLCFTTGR